MRAFTTTDTLKPLMKTEVIEMEFQTNLHVLKSNHSELSGSQFISGFHASTRYATYEFGLKMFEYTRSIFSFPPS
jgi:hypothetical protein